LHFGETLLLIPRSTFFLLGKFLLPRNLSPLYEVSDPIAIANPAIFLPILAFLALFAFLAFLRKKFPTPYPLTLILTFVLLTPAFLTFRKAGTIFLASDRYLYLPSLGVLLVITLFLREIGHRLTLPKPVIAGTSGFLIAFLCLLSTRQAKLWNDPEALFAHALALNPRSIAARTALAQVTLDAGKPQDAFTILKEGLKFGDDSRLHLMAGQVYAHVGQVEDALEQFRKAQGMDPGNADVWFSIGSIDEQTGKDEAALYNYRAAIQLDTSDVPARNGAGRILLSRGDLAGAEEQFREALKWNPNSADAHRGMADLLVRQGKQAEADRYRATAREIEQSSE
jgi:tetratricopeptide (TPR) repeat protein